MENAKAKPVPLSPTLSWMEFRVVRSADVQPACFLQLFEDLSRFPDVFELVVANMPSDQFPRRRTVRYFLGCNPAYAQDVVALVQAMGMFAQPCDPPELDYPLEMETRFATFFAHFLLPPPQSQRVDGHYANFLAGVLSRGGAVRVRFRADPRARYPIAVYGHRREESELAAWVRAFFDALGGGGSSRKGPSPEEEERRLARKRLADARMQETLFACDVRVYGSPAQCRSILNVFPAAQNAIIPYRTGAPGLLPERVPSSGRLHLTARKLVAALPPLALLPLLWVGAFTPWNPGPFDLLLAGGALAASVAILYKWIPREPVVLSARELAQLFSLPTPPAKYPLEFAPATPTYVAGQEG